MPDESASKADPVLCVAIKGKIHDHVGRKKGMNRDMLMKQPPTLRRDETGPQRFSLSLPPMQNEALNSMAEATSLSKNELMRHAVALLNVAITARRKGLRMALVNDDDDVVGHIVSTV